MISEAEVRCIAAATKVDPMVIDMDYSLGWFLLGMRKTSASLGGSIFKGVPVCESITFLNTDFQKISILLLRIIYHLQVLKTGSRKVLIGLVIMMALIFDSSRSTVACRV